MGSNHLKDQDLDRDDLSHREDPYNVTQASRIYFLPNLMTAGNLFCGFMAIVQCIQARLAETSVDSHYLGLVPADHYRQAVYFIFGAAAFDSLDGRLARLGGRESLFGAEFDSLADVVSFGVAPALMMFFFILSPTQGITWFRNVGWIVGFVFLLCNAMRLARFNVITNPLLHRSSKESNKDFLGLPVPAAAGTVAAMVLFLLHLQDSDRSLDRWALTLPFLMLLIAFLMMSTIRYPSGKHLNLQTKTRFSSFAGLLALVLLVIVFKEIALLSICLGYIFFGIIRTLRDEQKNKHSEVPNKTL
jgi:CDP-diacylglycerol--serine O-phosphatidyltransferase